MRKKQNKISKIILFFFVLSSFGLAVQSGAHALMMVEMQQHKAMGHDMQAHCQPVICESVTALDNGHSTGSEPVSLIDLSLLPANLSVTLINTPPVISAIVEYFSEQHDYGPSFLQKTGILRV
ncbi:MAG: hypothetical protein OEY29_10420 [Gammaproteobacteria bacterium]|nr:hypothetical protein [Gammaproteobacteria bacterium]